VNLLSRLFQFKHSVTYDFWFLARGKSMVKLGGVDGSEKNPSLSAFESYIKLSN
jgi:uncharacterized protein YjlB